MKEDSVQLPPPQEILQNIQVASTADEPDSTCIAEVVIVSAEDSAAAEAAPSLNVIPPPPSLPPPENAPPLPRITEAVAVQASAASDALPVEVLSAVAQLVPLGDTEEKKRKSDETTEETGEGTLVKPRSKKPRASRTVAENNKTAFSEYNEGVPFKRSQIMDAGYGLLNIYTAKVRAIHDASKCRCAKGREKDTGRGEKHKKVRWQKYLTFIFDQHNLEEFVPNKTVFDPLATCMPCAPGEDGSSEPAANTTVNQPTNQGVPPPMVAIAEELAAALTSATADQLAALTSATAPAAAASSEARINSALHVD